MLEKEQAPKWNLRGKKPVVISFKDGCLPITNTVIFGMLKDFVRSKEICSKSSSSEVWISNLWAKLYQTHLKCLRLIYKLETHLPMDHIFDV